MTYDCFPFFNELDLLEIRLNVLKDVVDKFIIAEAPWTHSGQPKQLLRPCDMERFAAFKDRMIYLVAGNPPTSPSLTHRQNAWIRENFQRNELTKGLVHAQPDDLILLSDIDEIPDPKAIQETKSLTGVTRFDMRFYNFFLNFRNYSVPNWPIGTQACTFKTFLDERTYSGYSPDQFIPQEVNRGATLSKLRMVASQNKLKNAGWHFSYCGGIEAIITKLGAFAHTECNTKKSTDPEVIRTAIQSGKDAIGRGYRFFAEPIDENFPEYIRNNQTKFEKLIVSCNADYLRRTRLPRLMTRLGGNAYRLMVKCIPPFLVPFAVKVRDTIGTIRRGKAAA